MMRSGLYLVRPDSSMAWDTVRRFFPTHFYINANPPVSPSCFACCSHVSMHTSPHFFYVNYFVLHQQDCLWLSQRFELAAAWIWDTVCRHISHFCLFHTWVPFIFFFHYLPLTQTHTHSRICPLTRFFIYRKKDRLLLGLLRFHYFCHASPLSRVLHWQLGNTCKYIISPS